MIFLGRCSYMSPLPIELDVQHTISEIVCNDNEDDVNTAIKLCLYCMKTQIFMDGNKRASVIFANHFLISHGQGFLVIPEKDVPDFKRLLVRYYEDDEIETISNFMIEKCWKNF